MSGYAAAYYTDVSPGLCELRPFGVINMGYIGVHVCVHFMLLFGVSSTQLLVGVYRYVCIGRAI